MRILLLIFLFSATAYSAKDRRIDLSTGITYPSDGFAVFENPATLPKYQGGFFDAGIYSTNTYQLISSLSADIGKTFGMGIGFQREGTEFVATPGIGFALGSTNWGVSTPLMTGSMAKTFTVGMQLGAPTGPAFAIVAHNVPQLTSWSFGLGWGEYKKIRGEINVDVSMTSHFAVTNAFASAGISLAPNDTFTFVVRYRFQVVPTYVFTSSNLEAGGCYWFSSRTALYFLFQSTYGKYLGGLKVKL